MQAAPAFAPPIWSGFIAPSLPAAYSTWKAAHFPAGEPANSDPDGDGIENLLDYAFDTDPLLPQPAGTVLPVMTSAAGGNGGVNLLYTYLRPADRPGVVWRIQKSGNLTDWMEVQDQCRRHGGRQGNPAGDRPRQPGSQALPPAPGDGGSLRTCFERYCGPHGRCRGPGTGFFAEDAGFFAAENLASATENPA